MTLTILIALAAFATMVVMLGFGYQQVEQQRRDRSTDVLANAPVAQPGHCMLCNAPLRQVSTADQVVYEIEHRIDSDLQAVVALLGRTGRNGRTTPESFARIYQA